jgi:hypothetical protein
MSYTHNICLLSLLTHFGKLDPPYVFQLLVLPLKISTYGVFFCSSFSQCVVHWNNWWLFILKIVGFFFSLGKCVSLTNSDIILVKFYKFLISQVWKKKHFDSNNIIIINTCYLIDIIIIIKYYYYCYQRQLQV